METSVVWIFEFGLEAESAGEVSRSKADELMFHIVAWAEKNDVLVGGGYRRPTEIEATPTGPNYPSEGLFAIPSDE